MKIEKVVKMYSIPLVGKIAKHVVLLLGADIPDTVKIGLAVQFPHNALGTVIHNNTEIGNRVKIYQNVTIGRADIWQDPASDFVGFEIQDDAVLCAGCKILSSHGKLVVGKGSIIAANAVLTKSTGDNEIWGGIPAKKIGIRRINSS